MEENKRKIKRLWFHNDESVTADEDNPIEEVLKNGEMAHVIWYKWKNFEYNSKFVEAVEYEN